jgi:hypothetical protein
VFDEVHRLAVWFGHFARAVTLGNACGASWGRCGRSAAKRVRAARCGRARLPGHAQLASGDWRCPLLNDAADFQPDPSCWRAVGLRARWNAWSLNMIGRRRRFDGSG